MADAVREYHYRVDGEGRVFHDGSEIVDPQVLRFFLRAMRRAPDGRWLVVCQGERNWFAANPTPFVVQRLRLDVREGRLVGAELCFAGDYREPLDPAGLAIDGDRLVCPIRGGSVPARFGRLATQQLAPFVVEDGDGPALLLAGRRQSLPVS
jgi:hypothetical protein